MVVWFPLAIVLLQDMRKVPHGQILLNLVLPH